MKLNIFEYLDYKDVIKAEIRANSDIRGYQSKLAHAANCQTSFLSQVLNGTVHLTPDQVMGISHFWGLTDQQEDFWFLLLQYARAGKTELQTYLKKKLDKILDIERDIAQKIKGESVSNPEEASLYYSGWYWIAVHVILSIPEYQSSEKIAERLKLSLPFVNHVIAELLRMGFIQKEKQKFSVTKKNVHLPKDSHLLGIHHSNWRSYAIQKIHTRDHDAFHYSVVHGLSKKDFESVKALLLKFVEESNKIVRPSSEEEMIFVGLDCFRV